LEEAVLKRNIKNTMINKLAIDAVEMIVLKKEGLKQKLEKIVNRKDMIGKLFGIEQSL
jgi:hypothetical protein